MASIEGLEVPNLRSDMLWLNWTRGSQTISVVGQVRGPNYEHAKGGWWGFLDLYHAPNKGQESVKQRRGWLRTQVWENNSDVMSAEESMKGINHIRTCSAKQDPKPPVNTWMWSIYGLNTHHKNMNKDFFFSIFVLYLIFIQIYFFPLRMLSLGGG